MRLRVTGARIMVTISAAVALAGCGSSPSSTTAASTASTTSASAGATTTTSASSGEFDSCSVVSRAEAASAIGESVTAGVLGNATVEGGRACVFYGPSAPNPRTPNVAQADSVRVVVVEGSHASAWYDDYRSKIRAQPVAGLGDKAFYDGYASLSVLDGAHYVRIAVTPAAGPPSLSDEKKLAAAVLPKL